MPKFPAVTVKTLLGRWIQRIVPLVPRVDRRAPGSARGRIVVSPDFDAPLPSELAERLE